MAPLFFGVFGDRQGADRPLSQIVEVPPLDIPLTHRFDIIIKTVYASYALRGVVPSFLRHIYLRHLDVWNGLTEKCFYHASWIDDQHPCTVKEGADMFIQSFDATIRSVSERGWDTSMSVVPLNTHGFPRNGAHRIATAIALGHARMPVQMVSDGATSFDWGHAFFRARGMQEQYMDAAVVEWMHVVPNTKTMLLWPKAGALPRHLLRGIDVLYEKTIAVSREAVRTLVDLAYHRPAWAEAKVANVWDGRATVRLIVMKLRADEKLTELKHAVRRHMGHGKESVHSPDTPLEHAQLVRALLNPNSVQFLHRHVGHGCADVAKVIGFPSDDVMIDSGTVMSFFGLRTSNDIDIIQSGATPRRIGGVETHTFAHQSAPPNWASYHGVNASDLFCDPAYHGYCNGIRFVSIPQLIRYKKARNEPKDQDDVSKLMGWMKTVVA